MSESNAEAVSDIGLEVSSTALTGVVVDRSGGIIHSFEAFLDRTNDLVPQLSELLSETKRQYPGVARAGIAVPGLVRSDNKRVAYSSILPEQLGDDLTGAIRSATGLETIVENDANAAGYGEFRLGAGRGSRNMFYVTLGEGVGGAFIFDGRIWRGSSGFAGEFGYVAINSEGMRLEDVASTANIVRRTRSRFHQDSTSALAKFDERKLGIADIVAAANNEDDFAQLMLERTGTYVGSAIANVINLLNIEMIVIGGEIAEAKQYILDALVSRARELSYGPSFDSTQIVTGELGKNAAALGAALIAAESLSSSLS